MMLITVELAAINDNATPLPVKAAKASRVITVRDISEKPHQFRGRTIQGRVEVGQHVDIAPGESIRLYGVDTNRIRGPLAYDRTFRVGDVAEYDSYNTSFHGKILAITEKTVTISDASGNARRLELFAFNSHNRHFDLAETERRDAQWMD